MNEFFTSIIQHLLIVSVSTVIAALFAILLGVVSYWNKHLGSVIMTIAELIQTIPSLALLALLMIVFGLGNITLIVGLVLYALLPIVRNTYTGLTLISPHLIDAARGMGMSRIQRLAKVEIPLAVPMIFSGVKVALVNSLSIAVMGVLIGADGLGYVIYRGIQQHNMGRILLGAVPVVIMALILDYLMTKFEKRLLKHAV